MTNAIEMIPCMNISLKLYDKRKRLVRLKEHASGTALSARPLKDGIHLIVHIGSISEVYISSSIQGENVNIFCSVSLTYQL